MTTKVRGRDKFHRFKKYIILLSRLYALLPLKIRIKTLEHYRMTKGIKGMVLRYALLKSIATKCGDNVSIYPGVYLLRPNKLCIGDNVSIHPMCYIDSTGGAIIGNDISIAHGATIMSTTHKFENINMPIKDQGVELLQTKINDNVWIGAKATILAGIEIGSGSIIAANAVVTNNVFENTVTGGVPAQFIKLRA